jgi:tRNA-splicing ligase RtcB (3'-phosphate/5'-hydroxy nucleic acid ligase)
LKLTENTITKQFLINLGWSDTPALDEIITHAKHLIADKGVTTQKYLIKSLKRDFPNSHASLTMRETPAPLALAIEADTPAAIKNLNLAKRQITELLRCPVVSSGTLMPDACPAGSAPASMPVGGAIEVENAIIPAAHSADICCSLLATFYHTDIPAAEQVDTLMQHTRFGPGGRDKKDQIHHPVLDEKVWLNPFLKGLQPKAASHIADQGDGNHFAYLGEISITPELITILKENNYADLATQLQQRDHWNVIVTHHGSRSIGATLYTRGLDAAIKYTRTHATYIPDEAAWLSMDTQEGQHYWDALQYISRWTKANHQTIHEKFIKAINAEPIAEIGNEHNFVWQKPGTKTYLHGKGATPAWLDDSGNPLLGLIPLNMAEPILLTLGSNNTNHLSFSPHGAGRNMSRRAILRRYTKSKKIGFDKKLLEQDIENGTEGIEVRWFQGRPDVTETPIGYKPAATVREQIKHYQLANIIAEILPLASIMSGRAETYEKPLTPKQLRQMQHRKERRKINNQDWLTQQDHPDDY